MANKFRNTQLMVEVSKFNYDESIKLGLMQSEIIARDGKTVTFKNGKSATEFINCSYLGLDIHPQVQEAYRSVSAEWGVNFCCARSRISISPLMELERRLSDWLMGSVVTFPSVTATHMAVMPLVSSGILIPKSKNGVSLIFDKLAHSSMQFLKPILAQEAEIVTIAHNDLNSLTEAVRAAHEKSLTPVYVADGLYSMGGAAPIKELLALAESLDFYLYIDDAHGTSILGEVGRGPVLDALGCSGTPSRLILTFSLSKGFGTNGGGVLVPKPEQEKMIRTYSQIYSFSAALDFAPTMASLAALNLHLDGTVTRLQKVLRSKIELFDRIAGYETVDSPIRMVQIGSAEAAISICKSLMDRGFYTSVVFFPIVAMNNAQIRVSIASNHSDEEIVGLAKIVNGLKSEIKLKSTAV